MDRKELNEKWAAYCQNFVGQKPEGFSVENAVFNAQKKEFSEELLKKVSEEDWLESVSFCDENTMPLLGSMQVNREEIQDLTIFLKQNKVKMALGYEIGTSDPFHVVKDSSIFAGRDIWFVGDIHGDVLAFRSAIAFINSNSRQKPIYVLLGDIFDRNDFSLNVVLDVLKIFKESPDSIFMIAGNHDDGLSWNENGQIFSSTITPQQYTEFLNVVDDDLVRSLMIEFVKVIKALPLGLVLPNGLLVTHGGVPSRPDRSVKNIWEGLKPREIKNLIAEKRSEFQRNRFMGDVSSGSKLSPEFSWAELIHFSHAVESAYGVQIRALLRGHDHCDLYRHEWVKSSFKGNENCADFERVQNVLTMTTMVLMDEGEKRISGFLKRDTSCPSVAHYVADALVPKVYSLEFSTEEVMKYSAEMRKYLGKVSLEMVEKHLNRLNEDLQEIEEDLSEDEKKFAEVTPAYEEQKAIVDRLNLELSAAEKKFNNIESELGKIGGELTQCESGKIRDSESLEGLSSEISKEERSLKEMQNRFSECNTLLLEMEKNKKDKSLGKRLLGAIKNALGLNEGKDYSPDELKKKVSKIMNETKLLHEKIEGKKEENKNISESLDAADSKIRELKEERNSLMKQKLDENPKLESLKESVRKETQKFNELQNALTRCERGINQAKSDVEIVQQDINMCTSKKDVYASWCAAQNG